jgi:hypothetical protein
MASIGFSGDTSGLISVTAPLVAGSGVLTLPTGTDTLVGKATTDTLTNKSIAATQLTGTIAAAVLPAGTVLQVVQGTYATSTTNSTTTYADTGLTASITPTRNTSKILVMVIHGENGKTGTTNGFRSQLLRGATILTSVSEDSGYAAVASTFFNLSGTYLDSPATTSSTTYKTQFKCSAAASTVTAQYSSIPSTITLMEIAV